MGLLDGKVAIVTGGGRGLGRSHAHLLAAEGAAVVVNDLGGEWDGSGSDTRAASETAAEIVAAGGQAVANFDDVADWEGGQRMVNQAVETFGKLDALVCNAGFVRDRTIFNMTEGEWDSVVRVHMKGHFVPTRWATAYWREQFKATESAGGWAGSCSPPPRPACSETPASPTTQRPRPASPPWASWWPGRWPATASPATPSTPGPAPA